MYLYIFEDGEIKKAKTFSETEAMLCNDGVLSVIDISSNEPKQYYADEWHELEKIDE